LWLLGNKWWQTFATTYFVKKSIYFRPIALPV
jgi:hypothetical protein